MFSLELSQILPKLLGGFHMFRNQIEDKLLTLLVHSGGFLDVVLSGGDCTHAPSESPKNKEKIQFSLLPVNS